MHSQFDAWNGTSVPKLCGCNCCLFDQKLFINNIDAAGDDDDVDDDSISINILLFTVHNLLIVVDLWRLSQLSDNDWQSLVVIFVSRFVCQTDGLSSAPVVTVGMVTSPFPDKICIDDGASNNEPWSITTS